jgi:phosphoglycerate dehydrogenase-like enzyme
MSLALLVIADPADRFLYVLDRLPPDVRVAVGETPAALAALAPEADVILSAYRPGATLEAVLALAPRVRWVHTLTAGVDRLLFPALRESPVPLTNSRGVYSAALAEWALLAMLHFAKDAGRLERQRRAVRWEPFECAELRGRTLGLVGYGTIARETAARARAFGMRVHALRRSPAPAGGDDGVERWYGPDGLHALLAASDYVLLALPLTPRTAGLVDAAALAAMKPSGVLINLGRGPTLVEADLARALGERRIRGAALDVFDIEPLPADHPFWALDNLLLSPHCADYTAGWQEDAMAFFVESFRRFAAGKPLRNVVDKAAGY